MNKIYFILVVFITTTLSKGQIGINTDNPNPNSFLHIEVDTTHIKGIIIPRLNSSQIDDLTRILENDTLTGNQGLKIHNIDDGCDMYWSVVDNRWLSQCGNSGNAKFTYSCPAIGVYGNYVAGKTTDSSNYLLLTVNVQKPGEYTIAANPTVNNGFSFVSRGFFNVIGNQTIKIPAQGTPISYSDSTNFFNIVSTQGGINTMGSNCTIGINILKSDAAYNLNCSSPVVYGKYVKGTALTTDNRIEMTVSVASPGLYNVYTDEINGIKFKATGIFEEDEIGRQTISLLGEGTPLLNEDFSLKIYSNSLSSLSTCDAKIPIILPSMNVVLIGKHGEKFDWTNEITNVRYKALTNTNNFGITGKVKIENLRINNYGTSGNPATLLDELNSALSDEFKPDVIVYNSYGIPLNSSIAMVLSDYVNAGGILIFGAKDDQNTQANLILDKLFGINNAVRQTSGEYSISNVYPINIDVSDPIINGPFGNISGQHWGEEASSRGSIIIPYLPPNSIQLVSAYNVIGKTNVDISNSMVWYNRKRGFVYFGDSTDSTDSTEYTSESPSYYNIIGGDVVPKPKNYGPGGTNNRLAYNSILEMNVIAWALRRAASEGINYY